MAMLVKNLNILSDNDIFWESLSRGKTVAIPATKSNNTPNTNQNISFYFFFTFFNTWFIKLFLMV